MHGLETINRINRTGAEAETQQQASARKAKHTAAISASKRKQAAAGKTGWKNGRDLHNTART